MAASGIKAIDIMTGEVVIASPNMSVVEAARLMNSFRIGGLPVIEDGKLVGMLTERDIMRKVVAIDKKPHQLSVKNLMTEAPITASLDEDITSVANKMSKQDITRLPVTDEESKLMGIITNRDVLRNSTEFVDILLEQAKIKGPTLAKDYTAFGKCELCGEPTHLIFKGHRFVCDSCIDRPKKKFKLF